MPNESGQKSASSDQVASLTLLVDTPNGQYVRQVAHASPLPKGLPQGKAAEVAMHSAAATWGLPDFVYRPRLHKVRSGIRELGDGMLLVGQIGVVIQVKSRMTADSYPEREKSWIQKAAEKAVRQAEGTVRAMLAQPRSLVNGRGREITIEASEYEWLVVVIIDHEELPGGVNLDMSLAKLPTVVLVRRDWEFLFDQLRSTYAVASYLTRAASSHPVELGKEPVRYYEFAAADVATPPRVIDPRIAAGGFHLSAPLLPQEPAGRDSWSDHALLRIIMEDVATSSTRGELEEVERLQVLGEMDRLPVAHRTELGRTLLSMMRDVVEAPLGETKWRLRRYRFPPPEPHLAFGACSVFNEAVFEGFRQWVALRHHEFAGFLDRPEELKTVGVLLTPRDDGLRPWDTTMVSVRGDLKLTSDELKAFRNLWGRAESETAADSAGGR